MLLAAACCCCSGPTVEHIYRRALLVMWPRSQSLSYAQNGQRPDQGIGLPAVLSVLKRRITDAEAQLKISSSSSSSKGSRSKSFKKVAKHVLAALEASVQKLVQLQAQNIGLNQQLTAPSKSFYQGGAYRTVSCATVSISEGVSTVLQQGTKAVQLGVKGARDVLLRLVASVANSRTGLTDTALVKQLAEAAALLDTAAVGPLLQQLVTRCMPGSPNCCLSLVTCLKSAPGLQQQVASAAVAAAGTGADAVAPLLSLAASLPGLPPVQQQVVDKLVTAMQQDSSAAVAGKVAGMLQRLKELPQLQQQLASAAAASLIAAGPVQHMYSILSLLLSTQPQEGELRQQLLDAVCAALHSPPAGAPPYQASDISVRLPSLQQYPSLRQQLQAAMSDGIFANASLLAAQTDGSMLQLCEVLLSAKQLREKHFAAFAAAVAQRPGSITLLLQLAGKQHPESAMQQLVEAAIAAVRSAASNTDSSSNSSIRGATRLAGLQVNDWAQLVNTLWQSRALQRQLRRAVAEAVCTNSALLSAQSDASMLALSQQLLQDDQLQAAHFEPFAAAVAQRPSIVGLFLQLLQSSAVQQSAAALDCLVTAAADSIRNKSGTWQVAEVLQVASALEGAPEAQQRVHTAVAEAVFGNSALLAAQTDDSMLQLSCMLLADFALQDAHCASFAAAVLRRQDDGNRLLQQLLQADTARAMREQLVAAAADALRNRSSVWQISDATPLVTALAAWPTQQQQLKAAVVDAMMTKPALLTSQTESSILQLSQLLLETASLQAAHYEQFAAAVVQRPSSTALLSLLLQSASVVASAAAQEQLVTAAASAIRTRLSTWQVLEEDRLLSALNSSTALRKRVESAIAEAVFTRASLLTAQTDASMLRLSGMLLGNPQLRAAYYDHFAAAVSQRRDSYELLKQLLQSGPVTAALAAPEVQQLVACQIVNLQRLSAVPPFTWNMPQAVVPGSVSNSQQVRASARGVAAKLVVQLEETLQDRQC
jgi:hypothetical protein